MTRTWTLIAVMALLWGSVCAGQQGYADMAPGGLSLMGLLPNGDGASLEQTLGNVQGMLTMFQQCTLETGLPENLFGSGMGLQSPEQMIGSLNITEGLPGLSGQLTGLTLPVTGLTTNGTIQMPDFASLVMNW